MPTLWACSESSDTSSLVERYSPNWRQLSDSSKFAVVPLPSSSEPYPEFQTAVRCWTETGTGQICLYASEFNGAVSRLSLSIRRVPELPSIVLSTSDGDGYSCAAMMGAATEDIRRSDNRLTSNRIDYRNRAWGRDFVVNYMRDNNVTGEWFDCVRLLRIVNAGSLETLSTTEISRSMLPD